MVGLIPESAGHAKAGKADARRQVPSRTAPVPVSDGIYVPSPLLRCRCFPSRCLSERCARLIRAQHGSLGGPPRGSSPKTRSVGAKGGFVRTRTLARHFATACTAVKIYGPWAATASIRRRARRWAWGRRCGGWRPGRGRRTRTSPEGHPPHRDGGSARFSGRSPQLAAGIPGIEAGPAPPPTYRSQNVSNKPSTFVKLGLRVPATGSTTS